MAAVSLEPLPQLDAGALMAVVEAFRDLPGLTLFEAARPGGRSRWSYLTADPVAVVERPASGIDPLAAARRLLGRLSAGTANTDVPLADRPPFSGGLAGFLGYDLARRLERLPVIALADQELPPLRLALHDWVLAFDRRRDRAWLAARACDGDEARLTRRLAQVRDRLRVPPSTATATLPALTFRSGLDRPAYEARIQAVRDAIAAGELFQANLARRLEAAFSGDPWPVYHALRTAEPAHFATFLDLGPSPNGSRRAIVSASPEPFLSLDAAGRVASDPIKGTRPRGDGRAEERRLAGELLASAKDRAENVMIVDVVRNDLGRVCRTGSVRVPRLCRLERTASVQHLVSTVIGQLAPGRDAFDVLAAAFPGGSISGAPKIRAMELIEELEPVRRGPYTGAAGWIDRDGAMATSMLIRTFVADGERLTLHVGGGITWDSDPAAEWDETVAKAHGPLAAIGASEATTPLPADVAATRAVRA